MCCMCRWVCVCTPAFGCLSVGKIFLILILMWFGRTWTCTERTYSRESHLHVIITIVGTWYYHVLFPCTMVRGIIHQRREHWFKVGKTRSTRDVRHLDSCTIMRWWLMYRVLISACNHWFVFIMVPIWMSFMLTVHHYHSAFAFDLHITVRW